MSLRARQMARTRQAIADGCEALLAEGKSPSINDVAERTGISRATIYRYFKSVNEIVYHVMSDQHVASAEDVTSAAGPDPVARVAAAERTVNDYQFANPNAVRQFEVSALQRELEGRAEPGDRPARRLRFIDEALAPVADRLDPRLYSRLRHGLALAMGSQALVALSDACRLPADEARDVTSWVCRVLVERALAEAGQEDPPAS